ncbi:HAD family hydrolase [Herbaspirillum lusitanum]|uniref:HAD family hydrolase n=1 Tax=Herbaspirillum lusitanum TaxID=213312 RepID=UPI000372150B|nr:HAD-IA family hydrolase [Herbaspirillum lusitanum]
MEIKAIFFDVANTLLHKPQLYSTMRDVLLSHGVEVPHAKLVAAHRFLSEAVVFPDRTSRQFYRDFNSHLVRSFGVVPAEEILDALFSACSYLPWQAFPDTDFLPSVKLRMGVLSNWDTSLREKLPLISGVHFEWILGSEEQGRRKPDPDFFKEILRVTGLQSNEIIYVGDSMRLDIEPALRLGLNAILIDRDDLYPHSNVKCIKSLHGIAGHHVS